MSAQERIDRRKIAEMNQKLQRANKFKNVWTEVDGIKFQSKAEAKHYSVLKLRERAGEITDLKLQPRYPLIVNDVMVGHAIPDFSYMDPSKAETGMLQLIDVKGVATPLFKFKAKLFHAIYGIQIQVVK